MAALSLAMTKLKSENNTQLSKAQNESKELKSKLAAAEKRYSELESKKKEASTKKMAAWQL